MWLLSGVMIHMHSLVWNLQSSVVMTGCFLRPAIFKSVGCIVFTNFAFVSMGHIVFAIFVNCYWISTHSVLSHDCLFTGVPFSIDSCSYASTVPVLVE